MYVEITYNSGEVQTITSIEYCVVNGDWLVVKTKAPARVEARFIPQSAVKHVTQVY